MLKESLLQMKDEVEKRINEAVSSEAVDQIRVEFFGKKGKITEVLKGLKDLSVEEKKEVGKLANDIKVELENKINNAINTINDKKIEEELKKENFDITFPGYEYKKGSLLKSYP